MTAYELADELTKMFRGEEYDRLIHEIPDVLREQADRIVLLEKRFGEELDAHHSLLKKLRSRRDFIKFLLEK